MLTDYFIDKFDDYFIEYIFEVYNDNVMRIKHTFYPKDFWVWVLGMNIFGFGFWALVWIYIPKTQFFGGIKIKIVYK